MLLFRLPFSFSFAYHFFIFSPLPLPPLSFFSLLKNIKINKFVLIPNKKTETLKNYFKICSLVLRPGSFFFFFLNKYFNDAHSTSKNFTYFVRFRFILLRFLLFCLLMSAKYENFFNNIIIINFSI